MKQLCILLIVPVMGFSFCTCDSVTGEVIDDYKRSKKPVAAISNLPAPVTTGRTIRVNVGGRDICRYMYRINDSDRSDRTLPKTWKLQFHASLRSGSPLQRTIQAGPIP